MTRNEAAMATRTVTKMISMQGAMQSNLGSGNDELKCTLSVHNIPRVFIKRRKMYLRRTKTLFISNTTCCESEAPKHKQRKQES